MLDPDQRSLLTSLLTPPPGMVFDSGLATTFTLDPLSLLTVPVHLTWLASGEDRGLFRDGIRLLEALRRVSDRFTVYAQRGRMQAPAEAHALYGLLETSIVEVRAPRGGAFHPKLWVLRFVHPDRSDHVLLRLGVLSRNLTGDRSWDLALQLEGSPSNKYVASNKELGELITKLPSFATDPVAAERRRQTKALANELERTSFDVPRPWENVIFHTLGLRHQPFVPPRSDELVVISPFVKAAALLALCKTTAAPLALVSRPEELAALAPTVRTKFRRCLVLHEAAETEDGEDAGGRDAVGLHAKAYLARCGDYTHLFVGSANATDAALLAGKNVEVLAELKGRWKVVGGGEDLLSRQDFGAVLVDFDSTTPQTPTDPKQVAAEQALDIAQAALADATLEVHCDKEGSDAWQLCLVPSAAVALGNVGIVVWPLSLRDERAVDGRSLAQGHPLQLAIVATADITGLLGFALTCGDHVRRFALNLRIHNLPETRDAAILRRIVRNREGFLRYVQLLLGDLDIDLSLAGGSVTGAASWSSGGSGLESLLENLVRAFAQDRERLEDVRRVVDRLRGDGSEDVVPPEFLAVWDVFTTAMRGSR